MTDFDALYREHAAHVYRFALSLSGNPAVAEDITSETFVRVWTARERVDLTTVIGYLLTIALAGVGIVLWVLYALTARRLKVTGL